MCVHVCACLFYRMCAHVHDVNAYMVRVCASKNICTREIFTVFVCVPICRCVGCFCTDVLCVFGGMCMKMYVHVQVDTIAY